MATRQWARIGLGLGLVILLAAPQPVWAGHAQHHFTNAYLLLLGRMTLPEQTLEVRYVPEYTVKKTDEPSGDRISHTFSVGYGVKDPLSLFLHAESSPRARGASPSFDHWSLEGFYRILLEPVEVAAHGSLVFSEGRAEGNAGLMAYKSWQRWALHGDVSGVWGREEGDRTTKTTGQLGLYYRLALQGIVGLSLDATSDSEWSGGVTLGTFLGQNLFFGLDLERGLNDRTNDYHGILFLQFIR